jgi:hypothetical protein
VERLLLLQNPWRFETYKGKWHDRDTRWTSLYKEQVPWKDLDDGMFFTDVKSFKEYFLYFLVQFHRDNYVVSYYDRTNDDSTLTRYTFTTTRTQDLHVAGDTYDPRMYAFGCKTEKVMAQLLVREVSRDKNKKNPTLGEKYFSDWIGFGHVLLK